MWPGIYCPWLWDQEPKPAVRTVSGGQGTRERLGLGPEASKDSGKTLTKSLMSTQAKCEGSPEIKQLPRPACPGGSLPATPAREKRLASAFLSQAVGTAFPWVFSLLGGLSLCPARDGRLSCVWSSLGSLQPLLWPVCQAPSPGMGTPSPWTLRVERTSLALCIFLQNLLLRPDHLTELPFYFMLRSFFLKTTINGRIT